MHANRSMTKALIQALNVAITTHLSIFCSAIPLLCLSLSSLAGEVVEKELVAHKEMVVELRRQLEEKESDLQVGRECGGLR